MDVAVIDRSALDRLIRLLREREYLVVGPTRRGAQIVYDRIESTADLPVGWRDVQEAGTYRLEPRRDEALFGYVVGPHAWKRFLHPPETVVWAGRREDGGFVALPLAPQPRYAFFGARPCELAAMEVQDRVFLGAYPDPTYRDRRTGSVVVAVDCTEPRGTCFCVSMGTGPGAADGFDLALTEVIDGSVHHFLIRSGTILGAELLAALDARPADPGEVAAGRDRVAGAAKRMGRTLETEGLKELLQRNPEHPRWERIAAECLGCANCTMVCPTCFCATIEDDLSLDGTRATRTRRWDSCFTEEFSYIHGGPLRVSPAARYRQWMTHKLASWWDQFEMSGCVGCGRCITWCPVGIDITHEAALLRAQDQEVVYG